MALTVDLSKFKDMVRKIAYERNRSEAEVVNKGLTTAIIGSSRYPGIVQLAPKASAAQIRTDLRHDGRNVKMTTKALKLSGYFATKRTRAEIQAKIAEVSKARLAKRLKSRAYIAAGWIKALRELGIIGNKDRGKREVRYWEGGTAAKGYAVRATARSLVAKAFSMSRGSEEVLPAVMQMAVDNASQDMADYFLQKIGKLFRSASQN